MSKSISVAQARAELPNLLRDVERGETVEITRRGRPVAIVLSVGDYERLTAGRRAFADAYRAWRASVADEDLVLPQDYFRQLRDRSPGRDTAP
ncbi:MAG: type II toxin-antitoxin system Phd/YefM family antitoxin [Myxococcales bacterium]|nr:type II toxin-antitoxin system Phd/YefM family antitoxin [Myxococcales bacterium]